MVVDASVVLDVLLKTARGRSAAELLFARGESLHAPHLVDVEVTQALRRSEALACKRIELHLPAERDPLHDFFELHGFAKNGDQLYVRLPTAAK